MTTKIVYKASEIIPHLTDVVVLDTETSSLRPWKDGKILAGLGVRPVGTDLSFYIPFRQGVIRGAKQAEISELEKLCKVLKGRTLVWHNPKFDLAVLYQEGIDLHEERNLDTVVLTRLTKEDELRYDLKTLGVRLLNITGGKESEKQLKLKIRKIMKELGMEGELLYSVLTPEEILEYLGFDLLITEKLYERAMSLIKVRELEEVFELEIKLTKALFESEKTGFKIDVDYVTREKNNIEKLISKCETGIYKQAGEKFNINSTLEVKKVLNGMGFESPRKTPKGADSWNKIALEEFDNPLGADIVKYRALSNIRNYYDNFLELMDKDGVIHPSFHQAGTKTGRFSCREPNLQNIPRFEGYTGSRVGVQVQGMKIKKQREEEEAKRKRYEAAGKKQIAFDEETQDSIIDKEEGELFGKVRGAFIPRPNTFLLFIDWSQIELRIFADYAGEIDLIKTFELGLDVHAISAQAAFGDMPKDKESQLYKWVRTMGKQIAFGLLYGMGIKLLAVEIGKSEDEAKLFMSQYFNRFKKAKAFMKTVHKTVENRALMSPDGLGYLKNKWGRRRYLPKQLAFKGVNFLVQGSAADLMKDSFVRISNVIEKGGYETRIVNSIHDEFQFEVPYNEIDIIYKITDEMIKCGKFNCKLMADLEWSPTRWGEKVSLSCDRCTGTGNILKLKDVSEEEIREAVQQIMYANNEKKLNEVIVEKCPNCSGRGYDLSKIKRV